MWQSPTPLLSPPISSPLLLTPIFLLIPPHITSLSRLLLNGPTPSLFPSPPPGQSHAVTSTCSSAAQKQVRKRWMVKGYTSTPPTPSTPSPHALHPPPLPPPFTPLPPPLTPPQSSNHRRYIYRLSLLNPLTWFSTKQRLIWTILHPFLILTKQQTTK